MTITSPMDLLQKTQALIELERSLTRTLERVEPWLTNSGGGKAKVGTRVRPIPTSMDEAHKILAVARNFSSRTSAPAGWNPNAPVMGFSTPNPLPHQLRGGALAALELQRARQAEQDKKRKRQEELEEEQNKEKAKQESEETNKNKDAADGIDNKKEAPADKKDNPPRKQQHNNRPQPPTRPGSLERRVDRPVTTMNLSDSSSEEDSDDDEDSD